MPEKPRAVVDGIAQDVANMSDERPDRYDLLALRRIIGERLAVGSQEGPELEVATVQWQLPVAICADRVAICLLWAPFRCVEL